ncbi:MAG: membrane protein insertase YidC [Planctomycetales bacterium]
MDYRRLLLFAALSFAFMIGWGRLMDYFYPPKPAGAGRQQEVAGKPDPAEPPGGLRPPLADDTAGPETPSVEPQPEQPAAEKPDALPAHPDAPITLGSIDPDTGYFLEVQLTSKGAAVERIRLNDERYRELDDPKPPLSIVGATDAEFDTLETRINPLDGMLGQPAAKLNWELVETVADSQRPNVDKKAVYRLRSPDGTLEATKTYRLEPGTGSGRAARDTEPAPYKLHLDLTVKNLGEQPATVSYLLQGPVGVPLENADNTRYYRGARVGFLDEAQQGVPLAARSVTARTKSADDVAEEAAAGNLEEWRTPIRYVGVDEQYFAALLVPADQLAEQTIAFAVPQLVSEAKTPAHSDISVQLQSVVRTLEPGQELTDSFALYAGPKRQDLLADIGAGQVQDFGWFAFVAKPMLWLLNAMHNSLAFPYGIAIICLTIIVRGCMFPLSKKQTASAKKMKELQPKIAELKKKYANDKEKMARAQMELFSKHNYNPFAGCLPIIVQLPIFIGLYQALGNAVDLRLASFLWADNLAAPDALFQFPGGFRVPIVGWTEFNLLPIITIVLFIVQQKMFMPPPTDEQSAMQQKMMSYMMVFMGFLFYRVPAGLCVYFIASALWGLGERKILDWTTSAPALEGPEPDEKKSDRRGDGKDGKQPEEKKEGLLARLLAAADSAGTAQTQAKNGRGDGDSHRGPRGKKKKTKPRR